MHRSDPNRYEFHYDLYEESLRASELGTNALFVLSLGPRCGRETTGRAISDLLLYSGCVRVGDGTGLGAFGGSLSLASVWRRAA